MIYHNNLLLTGSFLTCGTLGFPGMYRDGKQPGNSLIPDPGPNIKINKSH